jgi:hypothetical protein
MFRHVLSTRLVVLILSIAATGLFVAGSDAGVVLPPPFTPTYIPATVSPVAGAHTDTTVNFSLGTGSANFSAVIGFLPDDFGVGTCAANSGGASLAQACADDSIPNGAFVGSVVADATLGLLNDVCDDTGQNPISWNMMDATTDMSALVTFEDDPIDADDIGEEFEDDNANGLPDGADLYPAYLTRLIFGPNPYPTAGSAPLQPMLRSYGKTRVASTDVSLQFLLFPPGIIVNGLPLPATSGYSLITVLQNTGDPGAISMPGTITDSCSPVTSLARTYGVTRNNPATVADEGGTVVLTVPSPGTYEAHALLFSNYDQDGDGIENQMDTCPFTVNAGNPTIANSGDADGDGLDEACDPNDNDAQADQDTDGFDNRGDNCPQVANGTNLPPAQAQDDFNRDGIGFACNNAIDVVAPTGGIAIYPGYPNTNICVALGQPPACLTVTGPVMGDTNCSAVVGVVNAVDALQVLRRNASLEPYGACANNAEADVDCSGTIDAVDALKILRHSAGLSVAQNEPPPCPDIGTPL